MEENDRKRNSEKMTTIDNPGPSFEGPDHVAELDAISPANESRQPVSLHDSHEHYTPAYAAGHQPLIKRWLALSIAGISLLLGIVAANLLLIGWFEI